MLALHLVSLECNFFKKKTFDPVPAKTYTVFTLIQDNFNLRNPPLKKKFNNMCSGFHCPVWSYQPEFMALLMVFNFLIGPGLFLSLLVNF